MLTKKQIKTMINAVDKKMGNKFCFKCNSHRPLEGGGYIFNNKSNRFLCKTCLGARRGVK